MLDEGPLGVHLPGGSGGPPVGVQSSGSPSTPRVSFPRWASRLRCLLGSLTQAPPRAAPPASAGAAPRKNDGMHMPGVPPEAVSPRIAEAIASRARLGRALAADAKHAYDDKVVQRVGKLLEETAKTVQQL